MQKHTNSFFLILRLLTYLYRKKNCQICQCYDVINIFSNGKLFRLDYLIELIFLDYKNLV
jgi:hypothetical protein